MSIRNSASNLSRAAKDLAAEWEETREHWRDAKSRQFAEEYLQDLPNEIAKAAAAMEEIGKVLRRIQQDCE